MGGVSINKPPIFYTRIVYIYVIVAEVYPTELLSRKIFLMFI